MKKANQVTSPDPAPSRKDANLPKDYQVFLREILAVKNFPNEPIPARKIVNVTPAVKVGPPPSKNAPRGAPKKAP